MAISVAKICSGVIPPNETESSKKGSCPIKSKIMRNALTLDFPVNRANVLIPASFNKGRVSSSFSSVIDVEKKPIPANVTSQKFSQIILVKKSRPGEPTRELVIHEEKRIQNTIPIHTKRSRCVFLSLVSFFSAKLAKMNDPLKLHLLPQVN